AASPSEAHPRPWSATTGSLTAAPLQPRGLRTWTEGRTTEAPRPRRGAQTGPTPWPAARDPAGPRRAHAWRNPAPVLPALRLVRAARAGAGRPRCPSL